MMPFQLRHLLGGLALGLAFALTAGAPAAEGQYFGRNKVQYGNFQFEVLKTEHFDILYYPEEKAAAGVAGRLAERWYARVSKLRDHQLSSRQTVIMYVSHPDYEPTNTVSGGTAQQV